MLKDLTEFTGRWLRLLRLVWFECVIINLPITIILQEGQISEAETLKLKLEQTQRERRLAMEESGTKHTPNWFVKKDDKSNAQWTFKSEAQKNYWNQRNEAKFSADMIDLW